MLGRMASDPRRLERLSFEAWVRLCFDHPASGPQWYFAPDAPYWAGPPDVTVAYVTRLLADAVPHIGGFSDEQLGQGFWYLVPNGASDCMLALHEPSVPIADRARCIRAFTSVFRDVFAARCAPVLSHLDDDRSGPLERACYMWWDILPVLWTPDDADGRELGPVALGVMDEILALDAIACQESALHGLGHWQHRWPRETDPIASRFLARRPDARPELVRYAESARCGCVL
jgi:hypothetical protein